VSGLYYLRAAATHQGSPVVHDTVELSRRRSWYQAHRFLDLTNGSRDLGLV
jgi:hypothetical protein